MDRETLFVRTLDDLARRVEPGIDEYEVLGIAWLVRKLLLDANPLAHQVNRERRLPIRYRINARKPLWELAGSEPPVVWSIQDGLDPDTALRGAEPVEVTQDAFLATVVMRVHAHAVTVKDVVFTPRTSSALSIPGSRARRFSTFSNSSRASFRSAGIRRTFVPCRRSDASS